MYHLYHICSFFVNEFSFNYWDSIVFFYYNIYQNIKNYFFFEQITFFIRNLLLCCDFGVIWVAENSVKSSSLIPNDEFCNAMYSAVGPLWVTIWTAWSAA